MSLCTSWFIVRFVSPKSTLLGEVSPQWLSSTASVTFEIKIIHAQKKSLDKRKGFFLFEMGFLLFDKAECLHLAFAIITRELINACRELANTYCDDVLTRCEVILQFLH